MVRIVHCGVTLRYDVVERFKVEVRRWTYMNGRIVAFAIAVVAA